MAYAQQYNFQMLNDQGTLVEVQIFSNGYSGGVTTLIGGSQPVVIEYNAVSDRTQGIRDSTCTLNMISQAGFDLSTIYTTDERQYRVDVYYNAALYWTGFVTQDFSNEPFMEIGTYEIQIIARCGLVGLQGFKFLNQSGYYLFGYITMTQLLAILFAKTGLTLAFDIGCNVYETRMNTSNCAFDQMYVNTQRFFGSDGLPMQCSDILEAVCQAFGLVIFQRGGAWIVVRQYELPQPRFWGYNSDGTYLGGPVTFDWRSNYGPSYPLKMINGDQMIGYDQGWQEVKVKFKFAFLLNAVTDGSFYQWSSSTTPANWADTFTFPHPNQHLPNGIRFVSALGGVQTFSTSAYVKSQGVIALAGDILALNFSYYNNYLNAIPHGYVGPPSNNHAMYNIALVGSSSTYWLEYPGGIPDWTNTTPTTVLSTLDTGNYTGSFGAYANFKLTANMPPLPVNGTVYVYIYGSQYDSSGYYNSAAGTHGGAPPPSSSYYLDINAVQVYKVDPANQSGSDSQQPVPIGQIFDVTQTASVFTFMPSDKEILLGDFPSPLYAGALCLDTAGTVTNAWKRYGVTESRLLQQLVTEQLMDLHKKTYRQFSGSTYGIMYYGDCWQIQGLAGSNYYVPTGLSIDLKNMQGSMSATEHDPTVGTYSSVVTIDWNKDPTYQS